MEVAASWAYLNQQVSPAKPLVGKVTFHTARVQELDLGIDDNWEPERHVDIIGWPEHEDGQVALALLLSGVGTVEMSP